MKKFYFLLMSMMIGVSLWSQTIKTWNGPATGGSWTTNGNWLPAVAPVANDIVVIPTGITGTISAVAGGGNITLGGLRIEGNSNITFTNTTNSRTITIANLTGTDFIIQAGSGLTLTGTGNGVNITLFAGSNGANVTTANISGTFTVNSGRTYTTSNSNVNTTVTGTIDNRGSIFSGSTAKLSFQSTGKYIHGQNGGFLPTSNWIAGSVCEISGMSSAYPSGMDQTFQNVIFNSTLSDDVEMSEDLNCLQNLTIAILAGTGDDFRCTDGNQNRTIDVGGKFTLTSGRFVLDHDNGGSELNVAGDFELNGGSLYEDGSGTADVNFTGTGIQKFTKAPAAIISNTLNFTINNNAKVDFGNSILNGSTGTFSLANGGKIITSHADGLRSTGAFGSIQVTGTRTFGNGADYEFLGASTGAFSTTTNQVRNLIINNATTNEVIAARPFLVTGALTLSNGHLTTTATNLVTLSTAGTASTTNGAYVNGPFAKMTNSAQTFMFPVGNVAGGLREIGIMTTANTASTFTAQFFRAAAPAGTIGAGLSQKSNCEYWDLSRPSGSPARVILSWASTSPCGASATYVTDPTTLRVAHLTAGTWMNEGRQSSTGNNTAGTITSGNILNTFSPFALASSSAAANPLPVVFANVKAYEKNNGVQIEWTNLTEKDVVKYSIEHSVNGRDFSAIGKRLPANNQNDEASYNAFDAAPVAGINYYRIMAEETTGKKVYSKILTINLNKANKGLKVYPNPVSGTQVTFSLSNIEKGGYKLRIINTAGLDIYKQTVSIQGSNLTQTLELPASIKPGVYCLVVSGGKDYKESRLFVVK
ncbi:MAG: T9SS type A sorting domain-containing protein [Chitinophagaceae bacterium]